MSEIGHTPKPWRYLSGSKSIYGTGEHSQANSLAVCVLCGPHYDQLKQDANARHIVHCVNTHDELVAACREALLQLEYLADKFTPTSSGNGVIARLNHVLAKADAT